MSENVKPKVLIQLDTDEQASAFDRIVAVDSGAAHVMSYGGVTPEKLEPLVHGAIFTRGPDDLKHTAVFIGGSNVAAGEKLLKQVTKLFVGPLRVSVMLDSSGANTTASAAVLAAARHVALDSAVALVLAGTGPVGQRAAGLMLDVGARVRLASRSEGRAVEAVGWIQSDLDADQRQRIAPCATGDRGSLKKAMAGANVVIAAGAAGTELLPRAAREGCDDLKVLIDLNAVPPAGIEGVEGTDKGAQRDGVLAYGAIGVGGLKMKIHKRAIQAMFETNDHVLDAAGIFELGKALA